MARSDLPLAGSVVIDLSDECLALGARWLSDFGADVIRIESASGDPLRINGPRLDNQTDIESGLRHLLYNAGKRSLALNFDAPGAWDLIEPPAHKGRHRARAARQVRPSPPLLRPRTAATSPSPSRHNRRRHPARRRRFARLRHRRRRRRRTNAGTGLPRRRARLPGRQTRLQAGQPGRRRDRRRHALRPPQRGPRQPRPHLAARSHPLNHNPLRQRKHVATVGRKSLPSRRRHLLTRPGQRRQMAHLRHHPQHASALGRIRSMALRTLRLRRPDRGRISGRHLHPGMGRRDPPRLSESLRIAKPGRTLLRRPIARLPRRAGQLRPRHRRRPAPPRTRSVPLGRASPIRPRHRSAPPADSLNGLRAGRPPRSNIGRQLGGHPGRVAGPGLH